MFVDTPVMRTLEDAIQIYRMVIESGNTVEVIENDEYECYSVVVHVDVPELAGKRLQAKLSLADVPYSVAEDVEELMRLLKS